MIEMPTDANPVTVVNADCLDVLRELPNGCVDAVITDPPYGLGFDYASYADTRENLVRLVGALMPEALRVSARVFVTPGQSQVFLYPEPDWVLAVTWNTTGTFGRFGYSQWMPILAYGKDLAGFGSVNGILKSDLMAISGGAGVGFMRVGKNEHPCPKPLNLLRLLVRRLTNPGDLILDPFGGSGTTAVAALHEGRRCVIIEKDTGYCEIIRRRVKEATDDGLFAVATPEQPSLFTDAENQS